MHKSRLVIGALSGIIVGIFFGDLIRIDEWWLAGIAIGLIVVLIFVWYEFKEIYRIILLVVIGICFGLTYFGFKATDYNIPLGEDIELSGPVINHPDYLPDKANYLIKTNLGKIRVTTARYPEFSYGDVLKSKVKLEEPFSYYKHQGIIAQANSEKLEKVSHHGNLLIGALYKVRDKFENILNREFSEPYASFAAGLILGSKRNIPDSLMSDFNRTGTTHIIAVSGYNVTILITYVGLILGIFSRRLKFWGSLLTIIGFVIITGAAASVIRAGILAGMIIFGRSQGRRINMLILILLTAAVMLSINPNALKYDISFQLSFLAFIGIVWLGPILKEAKPFIYLPRLFRSTLSETLAAQLMVLPILAINFGQVSIIAPIINLLILWIIPLTMLLVFLAAIFGLIYLPIGIIFGYSTYVLLKFVILLIQKGSEIPWAAFNFQSGSWWWLPVYFFLILLLIIRRPRNDFVNNNY